MPFNRFKVNITVLLGNGFNLDNGLETSFSKFRQLLNSFNSADLTGYAREFIEHLKNTGKCAYYDKAPNCNSIDSWSSFEDCISYHCITYLANKFPMQDYLELVDWIRRQITVFLQKEHYSGPNDTTFDTFCKQVELVGGELYQVPTKDDRCSPEALGYSTGRFTIKEGDLSKFDRVCKWLIGLFSTSNEYETIYFSALNKDGTWNDYKVLDNFLWRKRHRLWQVKFVSFTFTDIVDKFIESAKKHKKHHLHRVSFSDSLRPIAIWDDDILYPYGKPSFGTTSASQSSYDRTMLVGTCDYSGFDMIPDNDDKDSVFSKLVKTSSIQSSISLNVNKVVNQIQTSDVILVHGMSLGYSDGVLLCEILSWLADNKDHHLIIIDTQEALFNQRLFKRHLVERAIEIAEKCTLSTKAKENMKFFPKSVSDSEQIEHCLKDIEHQILLCHVTQGD